MPVAAARTEFLCSAEISVKTVDLNCVILQLEGIKHKRLEVPTIAVKGENVLQLRKGLVGC